MSRKQAFRVLQRTVKEPFSAVVSELSARIIDPMITFDTVLMIYRNEIYHVIYIYRDYTVLHKRLDDEGAFKEVEWIIRVVKSLR